MPIIDDTKENHMTPRSRFLLHWVPHLVILAGALILTAVWTKNDRSLPDPTSWIWIGLGGVAAAMFALALFFLRHEASLRKLRLALLLALLGSLVMLANRIFGRSENVLSMVLAMALYSGATVLALFSRPRLGKRDGDEAQ